VLTRHLTPLLIYRFMPYKSTLLPQGLKNRVAANPRPGVRISLSPPYFKWLLKNSSPFSICFWLAIGDFNGARLFDIRQQGLRVYSLSVFYSLTRQCL